MEQRLLVLVALIVLTSVTADAQDRAAQTGAWFDGKGNGHTREELDAIIRAHRLWVSDTGGTRANLSSASISGIDLSLAFLNGADLSRVDLLQAKLSGARLFQADLSDADMYETDLSGAHMYEADLQRARLIRTDLTGTNLFNANVHRAIFEPLANPPAESMARTSHLELITYETNSGPLTQMRAAFKERGFREAERKVTYALKRREAEVLFDQCRQDNDFSRIYTCGSYLLNWVAFDLTSRYGLNPGRPIAIIAGLWFVFSLLYLVFIHLPGPSGLYVVGTRLYKGRAQTQGIQIKWRIPRSRLKRPRLFRLLLSEWRVLRAAMMFSLMSAFNLGFRELDFGRWIRLLMKREYDLKPVGWVRSVSGAQSLVSLYLVALWLLTYFGRPFE